ncbi:polysaccharide biosynthesis protein [Lysobacter cavernae]|uniref:Polysaccharide biosynthesis protein n=1 Tax=Lysobacter cavernae TaxID=1685901 RepID=A0ABV7RKD5_9GAMM
MNDASRAPYAIDEVAERRAASRSIARMTGGQSLTPIQSAERSLIHRTEVARPEVDAFRELRTKLLATMDGNFVTLVAPVSRGSGGSFVARNLAAAFAFDEAKSALLMDCDLRHPSQHTTLRIDTGKGGLIDYLEDPDGDAADVLYDTGVPRMRLLPAGRLRDSGVEYFSSFRMRLLLDSLRSRYPDRYVFLDSPPVRGGPDARILADLADVIVLVAGYGRDTPSAINQAASSFDPNKFAGVVFNQGV